MRTTSVTLAIDHRGRLPAGSGSAGAGEEGEEAPEIAPLPLALYDKAAPGVKFSVDAFRAKSVSIKFGSNSRQAEQITVDGGQHKVVKFTWEALFKGSPRKSCYDIVVTARNQHGSVTRKRKACRLGLQPENIN